MKIKVLFSYSSQVVPPRCRNPRTVTHHDGEIELEIQELRSEDAPVALEVHKRNHVMRDNKHVVTRQAIPYRSFNGELWTDCRMFGCNRSSHTSGKTDWGYVRPPKVVDVRADNGNRRGTNYHLHLSLDAFDSREKVEKYLRDWASSWFILKGRPGMWAPAGEPRYVVMTFGMGGNHGGTALMLDSHYNSNISKDRYFSALDVTAAKECARRLAKGRGDNKSLPISTAHGFIKVLIPSAVRCVPQEQAGEGDPFINQMESMISTVKNPQIAGLVGIASLMSSLP